MNYRKLFAPTLLAAVAFVAVVGSIAVAEPAKDANSAAAQMKLPPGWTEEDMKAGMAACTPGKMHEFLAAGTGVWKGKATMWMYPGAEPDTKDCTSTVSSLLDGRFIKIEYTGEMPGMGPYKGFGIQGFDNAVQKFVTTWMDTCSTGMMTGTGELSADGKTLTYNCSYNCPIAKKPVAIRQVETITGPNTRTLELTGSDPKSGKEFKMLSIAFTKQ